MCEANLCVSGRPSCTYNKARSRKCFTKQVKACKQRCEELTAASWRNYFLTHKVKFSSGWSIRSKMILVEFIT